MKKSFKVYTDWGARWNPGHAGIWVFITDMQGTVIEKRYKYLGEKTNNEAEYLWAFYGIQRAIELKASEITLHMDSKLVIQQLHWVWKIKKAELKEIHGKIHEMIDEAKLTIDFLWIEREKNSEADRLSNIAMDKKQ